MNVTLLPTDNPVKIEKTDLNRGPTLEAEKNRLYQAAKDFESLFMYQLLKSMRETIPETSLSEGFGLSGGMGKDIYTQMFDQELASKMSGQGNSSLADLMYKSMERLVEAQFASKNKEVTDQLPSQNYIEIKREENTPKPKELNPLSSRGREVKKASSDYDRHIDRAAQKYKLDPNLLRAVIKSESNFNPEAISKAGAKGLMQLVDTTASDMGVEDVFDPEQNLDGGAKYLRKLLDQFGDTELALAAYNAGPGTVKRYGGIPPYPETQNYVRNIMAELAPEDAALK